MPNIKSKCNLCICNNVAFLQNDNFFLYFVNNTRAKHISNYVAIIKNTQITEV